MFSCLPTALLLFICSDLFLESVDMESENEYDEIATKIEKESAKYVDDYWKKRTGEKDDESDECDKQKPFDGLFTLLYKKLNKEDDITRLKLRKKTPKSETETMREVLDKVAKQSMSKFYNMLLPEPVRTSHLTVKCNLIKQ